MRGREWGRSTKRGGRVIHFKLILVPLKILNKTFNLWPNISKILIASVFQNWRKMHFLLHFHVCFSINRYEWNKFFMVCLYFEFQIKKSRYWSKAPLIFFVFFPLNYNYWKSQASVGNRKLETKYVHMFC